MTVKGGSGILRSLIISVIAAIISFYTAPSHAQRGKLGNDQGGPQGPLTLVTWQIDRHMAPRGSSR